MLSILFTYITKDYLIEDHCLQWVGNTYPLEIVLKLLGNDFLRKLNGR